MRSPSPAAPRTSLHPEEHLDAVILDLGASTSGGSSAGYDSKRAVLLQGASVAGPSANQFGAILCDRETERVRRVVGPAATLG